MSDPDALLGGPYAVQACCRDWALGALTPVAQTPSSVVFKAIRPDGTPAALKVLKRRGREEKRGAAFLGWAGGGGAAHLLDANDHGMLVEWLEGAPLGDRVRDGQDRAATEIICALLPRLHAPRPEPAKNLRSLEHRSRALFDPPSAMLPDALQREMPGVQALARHLLATATNIGPLHGDLHHDNIIHTSRGWLAFDPKGLVGDRAYEVANAFRNPTGAFGQIRQPARIRHLAARFAPVLGTTEGRVLAWAAVHTALSACWALSDGHRDVSEHIEMLPLLLALAREHGGDTA